MDWNREARKVTIVGSNGFKRRRHRTSSLRSSADEDLGVELQESVRLRDRVRNDRDRERERGRDLRQRDSINDDEDVEDEEIAGGGGGVRFLPPAFGSISNHHNHSSLRKTFPHSTSSCSSKVFKAGPFWKPADEMIGVSVPRKARSACTKRSHDRISGSSNNISAGGVVGGDQILRQASSSLAAPVSKKLKLSSGPKLKPPKLSSKTSSSNPEELEIEIAEVLYGLKTRSQSPSLKKEDSREVVDRSSSDTKSPVSSPVLNSASENSLNLGSNSSPLSAVAPKRKRPRQVLENSCYNARSSPVLLKPEIDQAPKSEMGSKFKSTDEDSKNNVDLVQQEKISSMKGKEMRTDDSRREDSTLTATASAAVIMITASLMSSEAESLSEDKFVVDLMAPPPAVRSSPENETKVDLAGSDSKPDVSVVDAGLKSMMLKDEEEKGKVGEVQLTNVTGEEKKGEKTADKDELLKPFENKGRNLEVQLDLEMSERDSGNKLQQQVLKQPQMPLKATKEEPATGKPGQLASSLPLPLSMATWPGGLPPLTGYMAPLQGVVSMDGSTVTPAPMPPFSQPRPKRCAMHCYIARNINYFQQVMKKNSFWQAAPGSASLFGSKPGNINAVTVTDLLGNNAVIGQNNVQDKGQNLASISSSGGKENNSQSANFSDSAHRKQQMMLQQPLSPVAAPSNLVGPAFIFPLNQQGAAARPAAAKSHTAASQASSNATCSAS